MLNLLFFSQGLVWHQNYLHDRQVKDLTTAIYFWKKFIFFANQIVRSDIDLGVTIDKYFFLLEQVDSLV